MVQDQWLTPELATHTGWIARVARNIPVEIPRRDIYWSGWIRQVGADTVRRGLNSDQLDGWLTEIALHAELGEWSEWARERLASGERVN